MSTMINETPGGGSSHWLVCTHGTGAPELLITPGFFVAIGLDRGLMNNVRECEGGGPRDMLRYEVVCCVVFLRTDAKQ